MIWRKKEGGKYRVGINFIKTDCGHGIALKIPLVWWSLIVGYYWGVNFNWRWHFCSNKAAFRQELIDQVDERAFKAWNKTDERIAYLERKVAKFEAFINEEVWKR